MANYITGDRDFKKALVSRLPWYDRENEVNKTINNINANELKRAENALDIIVRNLFLETAVELIYYLEKHLNIKVNKNASIEQRRNKVIAILLAIFEQTTEEALVKGIKLISGTDDVEIARTDRVGFYEIILGAYELIKDFDSLNEYLHYTIPAHLDYIMGLKDELSMSIITEHEYNWYRYFMCGQHKCGTIPRYATKYIDVADNVMEINVESEERQYNLPMTGLTRTGQKNPAFAMRTQTKVRIDSGKYGPTELVINVADGGTYENIDLGKVGD